MKRIPIKNKKGTGTVLEAKGLEIDVVLFKDWAYAFKKIRLFNI